MLDLYHFNLEFNVCVNPFHIMNSRSPFLFLEKEIEMSMHFESEKQPQNFMFIKV